MENETKSYNPFKMWGSWAGLIVGVIGTATYLMMPYVAQSLVNGNVMAIIIPLNILDRLGEFLQMTNPVILAIQWPLLPIVLLTPIFDFFYGWIIHSTFRKLGRGGRITLLIVIVLLPIVGGTYSYIQSQQAFQATLNSANTNIQSAGVLPEGAPRTAADFNRESLGMNAVMAMAQAEPDNLKLIDKMMSIARDESVAIDVRLTALESLAPRVSAMTPDQKTALSYQLQVFSSQVNNSSSLNAMNIERMTGRITMLQKLLAAK